MTMRYLRANRSVFKSGDFGKVKDIPKPRDYDEERAVRWIAVKNKNWLPWEVN